MIISKKVRIALVIIFPLIVFGIFYIIAQSKTINPIDTNQTTNNNYSVETGLENIAKIAVPAVENYASQDISESNSLRISRLSQYFAGDSQVYNYARKNVNSSVDRTVARALSVKSIESEGEDLNIEIKVNITSYKNNTSNIRTQTYWVTLAKIYDGTMIPYDIGEVSL